MCEAGWKEQFTPTRHGRLHHFEAGAGQPLILLHATGCSAWQWRYVLNALGQQRHVFALDIPGHGDSGPIGRHYSVRDYAEAVVDWIATMGLRQPAVAGSSIGGNICLALGSDFSNQVGRIVLIETPIREEAQWQPQWLNVERYFTTVTTPHKVLEAKFRHLTPELFERWNIDRNKVGARTMVDAVWAIRQFDAVTAMHRLRVPAAAILGENGSVRDALPRLTAKLGGDRVMELAGCGHFPMIDDPDGFVAALEKLLASA